MPEIVLQNHEFLVVIGFLVVIYLFGPIIRGKVQSTFGHGDYVSTISCNANRKECDRGRVTASEDFRREVRENFAVIKGVLLVLASGEKPDVDKLTELFR